MSERARSLGFDRLTGAHAAAAAGDALVAIALAGTLFFGVSVDEARPKLALSLLLTATPFALVSPFVGPAIDRFRGGQRLALVGAAAGRALLALGMASAADTLLLFPTAFGVLVLSRAHGVARSALLPRVVPPEVTLVGANARLSKVAVVAGLAAAVPGVLAQRLGGSGTTLVLATIAFGLAALAAARIPRPPPAGEEVSGGEAGSALSPRIRRALVANAAIRALGGFLLFVLAFGLRARGVGSAGFAVVLAATGAGSFAGATLVPRLRRASNEEWIVAVSLLAAGGFSLIASRSFGLDLAAVLGAAVGAVSNAGRLAFDSIVQRDAPAASRGRAFGRFEAAFQIAWVGGAILPVVIPITIEVGLGLASAGAFGTAAWFFVSLGAAGRRRLSA